MFSRVYEDKGEIKEEIPPQLKLSRNQECIFISKKDSANYVQQQRDAYESFVFHARAWLVRNKKMKLSTKIKTVWFFASDEMMNLNVEFENGVERKYLIPLMEFGMVLD